MTKLNWIFIFILFGLVGYCLGSIDRLDTNTLVLKNCYNELAAKHNKLVEVIYAIPQR